MTAPPDGASLPSRPSAAPLLSVRGLHRRFGSRTVLEVPMLDVFPGDLLALVGFSGCGKTTCLETLGLMSRCSESELSQGLVTYHLQVQGEARAVSLSTLWQDEALRTQVRADHLSFMFQRANLLPTLAAEDNVRLTLLLQGVDEASALDQARVRMQQVGLDSEQQDVRTFSGGMLQRLAFARAALPRFQLLFADEPTGNLDPENGRKVWEQLQQALTAHTPAGTSHPPPAILVVTHDLELACQFATRVVVIGKDGYLNPEHSLDRATGSLSTAQARQQLRAWMESTKPATAPALPQSEPATASPPASGTKLEASSLGQHRLEHLLRRHPLVTPKPLQKLAFVFMLWLAILALGLAQGTARFLKARMSDPYVSWLSLDLPFEQRHDTQKAEDWVRAHQAEYGVQDLRRRHPVLLYLQDQADHGFRLESGITVGFDEPLMQRICALQVDGQTTQRPCVPLAHATAPGGNEQAPEGPSSDYTGPSFYAHAEETSLLVTEQLLLRLGYPPNAAFLKVKGAEVKGASRPVALPIRAVVRALPNGEQLAMTPFMRKQLYFSGAQPLDPSTSAELIYFLPEPLPVGIDAQVRGRLHAPDAPGLAQKATVSLEPYSDSHIPGRRLRLRFSEASELNARDTLDAWLQSQRLVPSGAERLYGWAPSDQAQGQDDEGWISLNLETERLDQAPRLREDLKQAVGAELDLARVEALKNYDSVALSSTLLSLAVMSLSGLCAAVFITYSLYALLLQMREFLGTLLAFGASRRTLEAVFRAQLVGMLARAFVLALPLALGAGLLSFSGPVGRWLGLPLEAGEALFTLWTFWIPVFVGMMFVLGLGSVRLTTQRLLRQDPGALIYDRLS